jgi:UDP-2-acetamido-3-amino-2,3-dideoxy-glucuronate N-acetyltransferase
MLGVPAVRRAWVSRHGHRLEAGEAGVLRCPETGWRYQLEGGDVLRCIDWPEDKALEPPR